VTAARTTLVKVDWILEAAPRFGRMPVDPPHSPPGHPVDVADAVHSWS
jgi:hypothetical protein